MLIEVQLNLLAQSLSPLFPGEICSLTNHVAEFLFSLLANKFAEWEMGFSACAFHVRVLSWISTINTESV